MVGYRWPVQLGHFFVDVAFSLCPKVNLLTLGCARKDFVSIITHSAREFPKSLLMAVGLFGVQQLVSAVFVIVWSVRRE